MSWHKGRMARRRRRRGTGSTQAADWRITPAQLLARLAPGQKLIGLDVGEKTIGVAVSDALLMSATPRHTLRRAKFSADAEALCALAREEQAAAFVIGHPLHMSGADSPRAQAARAFARNLSAACGLPVVLWDERLSTAAAERAMLQADLSRARRAKAVDKLAAAWILQGLLDHLRTLRDAQNEPDT